MNARMTFEIGQAVELTEEGRRFMSPPPGKPLDDTGVVTGFGHRSVIVRVRRTGHRTPESFRYDFWRVVHGHHQRNRRSTL